MWWGNLFNCASGREPECWWDWAQGLQSVKVQLLPSSGVSGSQRALAGRSDLKHVRSQPLQCLSGGWMGSMLNWSQRARSVRWGDRNVPSRLLGSQSTGDGWPSQGTGQSPASSHLRHPSVAREHSISHFPKRWGSSPLRHVASETKLTSLTSTLYLTPQGSPRPERGGHISHAPPSCRGHPAHLGHSSRWQTPGSPPLAAGTALGRRCPQPPTAAARTAGGITRPQKSMISANGISLSFVKVNA